MSDSTAKIRRVERLTVKRGGRTIVSDFALGVAPGEIAGIAGENRRDNSRAA